MHPGKPRTNHRSLCIRGFGGRCVTPYAQPLRPFPTSSGKNRTATHRTVVIAAIVAVLVFAAMWVQW